MDWSKLAVCLFVGVLFAGAVNAYAGGAADSTTLAIAGAIGVAVAAASK